MNLTTPISNSVVHPVIKAASISRGTMVTTDLTSAREFYEQFLGLECVRMAADRMFVRISPASRPAVAPGADCLIEVLERDSIVRPQVVMNHWGIDVPTREDVDRIHAAAIELQDRFGLGKIMNVRFQHGVYAFYFTDRDSNWWEIEYRDVEESFAPLVEAGDRYAD